MSIFLLLPLKYQPHIQKKPKIIPTILQYFSLHSPACHGARQAFILSFHFSLHGIYMIYFGISYYIYA